VIVRDPVRDARVPDLPLGADQALRDRRLAIDNAAGGIFRVDAEPAPPTPARSPTARPPPTTAMPAQTSGRGAGPSSSTPVTAAAAGATPVSRPARLGPSRPTHEYHKTNATAVTATAR
jgi:hypothetical protein